MTEREAQAQLIAVLQQITELKRDEVLEQIWQANPTTIDAMKRKWQMNGSLHLIEALIASLADTVPVRDTSPYSDRLFYQTVLRASRPSDRLRPTVYYWGGGEWTVTLYHHTNSGNVDIHTCQSYREVELVLGLQYCITTQNGWEVSIW